MSLYIYLYFYIIIFLLNNYKIHDKLKKIYNIFIIRLNKI
jgi:hypothetical protein